MPRWFHPSRAGGNGMLPSALALGLLAALAFGTGGCVTVVTEVAGYALEDRVFSQQFTDAEIHANLLRAYVELDDGLPVEVNTEVWEGRVLLTGVLPSERLRAEVERIARSDRRVRAVYNEIRVEPTAEEIRRSGASRTPPAAESDAVPFEQMAGDLWIETKIKAQLVADERVHSVNYRWQCVRSRVYIIGRAASEDERREVVDIIRRTRGVLGVRSFIEVWPRIAR